MNFAKLVAFHMYCYSPSAERNLDNPLFKYIIEEDPLFPVQCALLKCCEDVLGCIFMANNLWDHNTMSLVHNYMNSPWIVFDEHNETRTPR